MEPKRILHTKIAIGLILTITLIVLGVSFYSGNTTLGDNSTSSKTMSSKAVVTDDSVKISIGGNSSGNFDLSRKYGLPKEEAEVEDSPPEK